MQALEYVKDPFGLMRINADAVVPHREAPLATRTPSTDVNVRRRGRAKLEGVAEQILQQLPELLLIRHHRGQGVVADGGSALSDGDVQELQRRAEHCLAVRRPQLCPTTAHAGVSEQVLN